VHHQHVCTMLLGRDSIRTSPVRSLAILHSKVILSSTPQVRLFQDKPISSRLAPARDVHRQPERRSKGDLGQHPGYLRRPYQKTDDLLDLRAALKRLRRILRIQERSRRQYEMKVFSGALHKCLVECCDTFPRLGNLTSTQAHENLAVCLLVVFCLRMIFCEPVSSELQVVRHLAD
jgi:hypothetical protein